jgi:hypothetical protein
LESAQYDDGAITSGHGGLGNAAELAAAGEDGAELNLFSVYRGASGIGKAELALANLEIWEVE